MSEPGEKLAQFEVLEPNDVNVVFVVGFAASRAVLFRGFTDPMFIRQWLLRGPDWSMPVCNYDLRIGGAYQFGWRGPEGETRGMSGEITGLTLGREMRSRERYDGEGPERDMLISMNFGDAAGGGSILRLAITYPDAKTLAAAKTNDLAEGMRRSFVRLAGVLMTPQS